MSSKGPPGPPPPCSVAWHQHGHLPPEATGATSQKLGADSSMGCFGFPCEAGQFLLGTNTSSWEQE